MCLRFWINLEIGNFTIIAFHIRHSFNSHFLALYKSLKGRKKGKKKKTPSFDKDLAT